MEKLTPAQRALFAERMAGKRSHSANTCIMHHSNLEQAPLSYNQEQIWLEEQIAAQPGLYARPLVLRLTGPMDEKALRWSIEHLIQRHAILRTSFPVVDGKPIQHIHPAAGVPISQINLRRHDAEEQQYHLQQLIEQKTSEFDLARKPPFDAYLIRLAPEVHVLFFAMHHIIFDAWSANILTRDLFDFYKFAVGQRDAPPTDLPVQYTDFAVWQKGDGSWKAADLDFWMDRFSGGVPSLELPVSQRTVNLPSYEGKSVDFGLQPEIAKALRVLCINEGATMYMGLLAVFSLLLSRLGGQAGLVIGTPVAGRSLPEINDLIGVFVNMLPMRCDLSGKPTFRQLLGRIRAESLQAFTHQDLPYEVLVRNIPPEVSGNQRGPVSAVFQLRNIPRVDIRVEGLQIEEMQVADNSARFDLLLDMQEHDGILDGRLTYRCDLFDEPTILRWLRHFKTLLSHLLSNPDAPVTSLSLLDEEEIKQICQVWNATEADYPRLSVPLLFEAQCKANPGASAISSSQGRLTYEEINHRANQLAHFLVKRGVEKGSIIGFCLERSIETVITMLAILKAGGVYLPLDPTYPAGRLAYMLQDAGTAVVITHSDLGRVLPPTNCHVIYLDRDWQQIAREEDADLDIQMDADDPAYLMYTSGSTGQPKGVLVPHKAIDRLVLNTNYIQITPEDNLAQVSNISFDAATFEIWGALLNGARLTIIHKDILLTPGNFAQALQEQAISILFLTTSLFNQLARQIPGALNSLRCLLFGGEQADVGAVRHLLQSGGPQQLIHVYGPTENTTFATWHPVEQVRESDLGIPIGRPVANTFAYILDEDLNLVPPGIAGELHLAGDGLAIGYWEDKELTRTKFIANPFSLDPDDRLYRTGDICRYLPDGSIVFMGRIDQQIKLRGHRIELGEIGAAVNKFPSVKDSVTVQDKSTSGETRLISYVVTNTHEPVSVEGLRDHLKCLLPGFMLPAAFINLSKIPITPNGKIDYSALSSLLRPELLEKEAYSPPQSTTEKVLAEIWSELLEQERVGREDNFFELGGHSLLVVSLCAHIEERLGVSLSFSEVYLQPTLGKLAALVDRPQARTTGMPQAGSKFFWCGNGFDLLQKHFQSPDWLFRLPLPAEDGMRTPQKSMTDVAAEYIQMIKSNQPQGPYYLGGFSFGGLAVYEVAQQLSMRGDEVSLLFLLEPARNPRKSAFPVGQLSSPDETQNALSVAGKSSNFPGTLNESRFKGGSKNLVQFFWQKAKNRLVYNNGSLVKLIRYQWYLASHGIIPASLRNDYITHTWNRMIKNYQPHPYAGEAFLLVSEGTGDGKTLPIEYVRKVVIPGAQTHTDPVFGAYSSFWIDQLSICLGKFKIL